MTDYTSSAPARLATRLSFFVAGFSMACLAPIFPFIKAQVGADVRQFGFLLLCLGLGSIIVMPVTGVIAAKTSARLMILVGGFGLVVCLPILAVAWTSLALAGTLFLFGAFLGTIDVAMNLHGAEVEEQEGRPLMSNFHAQYSIGSLLGAALMALLLSLKFAILPAALICAVIAGFAIVPMRTRLLSVADGEPEPFVFPRGKVLLLAILAAIVFLVEGAVLDWGALLIINRQLAATQSAGVGYILFSVAMVVGRLTGNRIVAAFGPFHVLVFGGTMTIFGVAVVLTAAIPAMAFSGFALMGLGTSNLAPILFSAAGRQKKMPAGIAIASVTTAGYAGVLVGPALVGFAANSTSLPEAFWLLALLMAVIPLTARFVARG